MILTPASTSRSATSWAASAGTASTPTTISSVGDDVVEVVDRPHRDAAELLADQLRGAVEDRDDPEAVVGEDVGGGDRLAEVAGAEQGDVVLARGAQDLADLGDQRLDLVADAALAELAEAREVAADLGRVDVGPGGELLGGDRLLAHLPGLDQDLQVAGEPRGDAERQPRAVAVVDGIANVAEAASSAASGARPSPLAHASTVSSRDRAASRSGISSLTRAPSTSITGISSSSSRCSGSSDSMSTSIELECEPVAVQRDQPRERLLAEVAAVPPVEKDLR